MEAVVHMLRPPGADEAFNGGDATPEEASPAEDQVVSFIVYGRAVPGGSKTTGVRKDGTRYVRDDNASRVAPWKGFVAREAALTMGEDAPLQGPLAMFVVFHLSRPLSHFGRKGLRPSAPARPIVRPDLTKLLRPLEDALKGIVWRDDSQVVMQYVEKRYGEPTRVEVTVWELT
jgi:Holliday junction resolvase RusA-like endonuclease